MKVTEFCCFSSVCSPSVLILSLPLSYLFSLSSLYLILLPKCGAISEVRLVKSQSRGRANAFAYVEFVTVESVEKALQLEHTELKGRIVFVSLHKERGSSKTQQKQGGFQACGFAFTVAT